nr:PAS domain-containing protein [Polyangiaceae bacterium]
MLSLRLTTALSVDDLATFEWHLRTDTVQLDDRARLIFGFGPDGGTTIHDVLARIHPDDLGSVQAEIATGIAADARMQIEYRLLVPGQGVRWIRSHGQAVRGPDGQPTWVFGFFRDVTEQHDRAVERAARLLATQQAWAEAEASRLHQHDLFSQAPVAIAILEGPRHDFSFANGAYRALVGGRDVVGKPLLEALPELQGQGIGELLDGVMSTGETFFGNELPVTLTLPATGQQEPGWFNFVYTPKRNLLGVVDGVLVSAISVTEQVLARRRIEALAEEVRASAEELRHVIDAIPLCVSFVTVDERFGLVNRAYEEWLGVPQQALIGRRLRDVIGEAADVARRTFAQRALGGESFSLELHGIAHPRGGVRDVYLSFVPRRGSGGQIEGYVTLLDDITERRRLRHERGVLRRQLEESQDWLRFVVEASGTGTWEMNPATHELVVGEQFRALFGLSADEPFDLAQTLSRMHPDERGPVAQAVADALAGRDGGRYLVEHRVVREPEPIWIETRGQAFFDADGKPTRFLGTSVEITARKRNEQERERLLRREREARQQAEEAGRLKDEFLATVSHELRTPLTAVLGWAQLLRRGNLPVERREGALATIERNARSQAQLIEDLLDMSRLSAGKLALDVEALDVVHVVGAALESIRPAADAKGIRLQPVLDSGGIVMGDPNRLQQVVWNLLMNAVKFTPKGGRVQVLALCLDSSVELTVADSGQGIAPDFLPHVFERFRQAESGSTRSRSGLGLGLSIVQQLVEMHGGTVEATSEGEGKGASFTVRLPLSATRRRELPRSPSLRPAEIALASPSRGELAGLRLLVVDDEKDTRELLIFLLEASGATVRQAASAEEGRLRLAEEVPDVLISDIGMPGEDGHSFLASVRRLPPARGGQVPAVALTAYAHADDRTRALHAGFSHHVAKPVETAELIAVIASLVRQP